MAMELMIVGAAGGFIGGLTVTVGQIAMVYPSWKKKRAADKKFDKALDKAASAVDLTLANAKAIASRVQGEKPEGSTLWMVRGQDGYENPPEHRLCVGIVNQTPAFVAWCTCRNKEGEWKNITDRSRIPADAVHGYFLLPISEMGGDL
jgi:hypothetical protein